MVASSVDGIIEAGAGIDLPRTVQGGAPATQATVAGDTAVCLRHLELAQIKPASCGRWRSLARGFSRA
jgi:hypothetical protein